MAPRPFTITYLEPRGSGVFTYEGPFGPLRREPLPDDRGAVVIGPRVGRAELRWPQEERPRQGRSIEEQLRLGVPIEVAGSTVSLHRRPTVLGATRARRSIRVDRPGKPGRVRIRGWGVVTLETEAGIALVQLKGVTGTVHPEADEIDVVVLLFAHWGDMGGLLSFSI